MIRFTCFLVCCILRVVESRVLNSLSNLANRWNIEIPRARMVDSNNTIVMDYGIDEDLSSKNTRAEIFNENCESPNLSEGILYEGFYDRGAHVFQIDPQILSQNTMVFTEDYANKKASMKFCIRYSLWSGSESEVDPIEINYLLTILTIHFDLRSGFTIDSFAVEPSLVLGDRGEANERDGYKMYGYLCDPHTYDEIPMPEDGFKQGEFVSVCAELDATAAEDGIYLKGIDNFVWTREVNLGDAPIITQQYSVKDGVSANVLTEYNCPYLALFCNFKTMLQVDFYTLPGSVSGAGTVSMAFKPLDEETPARHQRRLDGIMTSTKKGIATSRLLQDQQETGVGSSTTDFGITVTLAGSSDLYENWQTAGGDTGAPSRGGIISMFLAYVVGNAVVSLCT